MQIQGDVNLSGRSPDWSLSQRSHKLEGRQNRVPFKGGAYKGYYKGYYKDLGIGAWIIRIGFWGISYYNYTKEPWESYG